MILGFTAHDYHVSNHYLIREHRENTTSSSSSQERETHTHAPAVSAARSGCFPCTIPLHTACDRGIPRGSLPNQVIISQCFVHLRHAIRRVAAIRVRRPSGVPAGMTSWRDSRRVPDTVSHVSWHRTWPENAHAACTRYITSVAWPCSPCLRVLDYRTKPASSPWLRF